MSIRTISPSQVFAERGSSKTSQLIDVRTPGEFKSVHAVGATLIPLNALDPLKFNGATGVSGETIYLICASGTRAKTAGEKLDAAGVANIAVVDGGTSAWEKAGLPVIRGKGAISMERQVRIAAGSLVFVGVVLGVFVHRYFLALPAFVGAGLVFAGVTDTCGMAMILARLPWNQASANQDHADCATTQGSVRT